MWWLVHQWNSCPSAWASFNRFQMYMPHIYVCCGFLITHSWTDCRIYFVSVGDIPGPPRSQRSGVTRRAQSREELSSTGGSSHPLRPQTRTVSRSISVSVLQTNYTVQNIFWLVTSYLAGQDIPCITKDQHYRVSQEECAILRESVPYVKLYRYNPKHLYPKLNGYGDNGQRKVWTSCISAYCMSTAVAH